ncbi:MAG: hypothetical protein ACKO3G_10745 [Planctomycetaceae bacterium]
MRFPRFFTKKRGHRRTDSQAWGAFAEGLFYAMLFGVGLLFAGLLVTDVALRPAGDGAPDALGGPLWWLRLPTLLIPLAIMAFGGAGLARVVVSWGKSQEHRASSRRPLLDGPDSRGLDPRELPGVPACDDLENSPGTVFRYRLPLESPENWSLAGFGMFALLWNAIVVVLAVGVGVDLMRGTTDWLLVGLLVPFVIVGIGGIVFFVRAAVLATSVGPTHVEISDHPLRPGAAYDVLVGQGGASPLESIEMGLEMEETAAFRQGTDTRTQRLVVRRHPVAQWRSVRPVPGGSFEGRVAVRVPTDAMHSFSSANNAVHWRLVVRARPQRWPPFTRVFPVVVLPLPPEDATAEEAP